MKNAITLIAALLAFTPAAPARAATALEQLGLSAPGAAPEAPPAPSGERLGGGGPSQHYKPGSFAAAADKAFRGEANYITLYNWASPHPMDWTNLATLAFSYARNEALIKFAGQTHGIGHVAFEIGCTLPDGGRSLVVTGQTTLDGMGGFADQVKAGAGYSAFFGYVPGKLQQRADLEKELDDITNQEGEINFLTLKVSRASCLEAQRYIKAYGDEGVATRYGLGVRPLYREGGGCANVGVSVIDVAGPADFAALSAPWSRTFYIPQELLGTDQNHVGALDLAKYLRYDWSRKTGRTDRTLFFYDPDLIFAWVNERAPRVPAAERYTVNSSVGVTLDYSGASSPTKWWRNGGL